MLDASLGCHSMRCAEDAQDGGSMARTLADSYRRYLPRPADRLHPYASPLKARRLGELPPALIFHTEGDPLADEAVAYADKLRQAGN
ncbi:alpha/beta hydrolase, partial [Salmonella enterica]|nr:alpha/beta hydrolase [Salmonella enterica]